MGNLPSARCIFGLLVLCACAAFTAFAQELQFELTSDTDGNPEQHDILFRQSPSQRNGVGGPCRNNNHCRPELCCLLSRNQERTCQPMARIGEQCTEFQVKGGSYPEHCPCLEGICSLTRDPRPKRRDNGVCVPFQGTRREPPGQRQRPQFSSPLLGPLRTV